MCCGNWPSSTVKEPHWILKEAVIAIHHRQLAEHGGETGLRDEGLLDSALARARQMWSYDEPQPTISRLAAAYAHGLIANHPFVDGNKRVGLVTCLTFLTLNGLQLTAEPEVLYTTFMDLAAGRIDVSALAAWLETHSIPLR